MRVKVYKKNQGKAGKYMYIHHNITLKRECEFYIN